MFAAVQLQHALAPFTPEICRRCQSPSFSGMPYTSLPNQLGIFGARKLHVFEIKALGLQLLICFHCLPSLTLFDEDVHRSRQREVTVDCLPFNQIFDCSYMIDLKARELRG